MLKTIFSTFAVLGSLAAPAHAGCYEAITSSCEKGFCLDIQWNCEIHGYEDDLTITIWPVKQTKNNEGEYIYARVGTERRYRFLNECQWHSDSQDSFSCRSDGHTILAGRSYERQRYGMTESCPDIDTDKTTMVPDYRFACISGCTGKSIYKNLHDDSYNCH